MRTSEMWLRNTGKKTEYLLRILFGAYIAGLLWVTLFSRIGNEYRGFLYPFYSYGEILKGNKRFFFENAGNIVLFIPLGIILKSVGVKSIKRATMIGLASSLFIEISQTFFSLGVFECDDLMHNTIGTMLGYCFINRVWQDFQINLNRKTIRLIILSLVICAIIPFGYQEIEHQKMIRLAMLHNRSDGTKNLLVLNGDNGNAWDTNVQIKYLNDGRIHIKGKSDKVSWWPIGQVKLEPGNYSFSGLTGVEERTVGLELEAFSKRFAPDVGPNENVQFTLTKTVELMVYVVVYDGCDCDVVATPVIYREE